MDYYKNAEGLESVYKDAVMFLQNKLNSSIKIDNVEKKYRFEHSLRVANIAKTISEKEGQDIFITTLAAILHDVGKFETEINEDHGRVSAEVARCFLKQLSLTQKQENDILYCIAVHVDGKAGYEYENIGEAETVSDADNIDRFGVYRIYQSLNWDNIENEDSNELIEKYKIRINKLENFKNTWKLYTQTANEMMQKNLSIQLDFYKNLIEELKLTNFFNK